MVSIQQVRSTNQQHFHNRPLVAVFIGAASGIGDYTVRALTRLYSNQSALLRLYIVGRNRESVDKIISECSESCANATFHFVQAGDLTLIKEVDRVSEEVLRIERKEHGDEEPRIDLLVQTQGKVEFGPRKETEEGLDKTMSLLYYSRIRFILNLMPLLKAASETAHVISVYAAGLEGKLLLDDLSLRDPKNYGFLNARSHIVHMKTMSFERLARENPRLSFVHQFPGLVVTPAYSDPNFPWWFKLSWRFMGPIATKFLAISPEDSGSRTLFLATDSFPSRQLPEVNGEKTNSSKGTDDNVGSGAYAVNEKDETITCKVDYKKLRENSFQEVAWQHTMKAFSDIEDNKIFTQ